VLDVSKPGFKHASEAEYRSHLSAHGVMQPRAHLMAYRQFKSAYPDLNIWFDLALEARLRESSVGWGEASSRKPRLRPYLYFLVGAGYAALDWPWILASGQHIFRLLPLPPAVETWIGRFDAKAVDLGYGPKPPACLRRWIKYLHLTGADADCDLDATIREAAAAIDAFDARPDRAAFVSDGAWLHRRIYMRAELHTLRTVAFHLGCIPHPPPRGVRAQPSRFHAPPLMAALASRYGEARLALGAMPTTAARYEHEILRFADWLTASHPSVKSFADVTRDQLLGYLAGNHGKAESVISRASVLNVFFREATSWGWDDAPARPLMSDRDLPKRAVRVPRYIPADQLEAILVAIRRLDCPHQRAALLTARWSGARRSEIRWLELDCLDRFSDGTARLRIPAGKTKKERLIPLHAEAAEALAALHDFALDHRALTDPHGHTAKRLFVRGGALLSNRYLFDDSLVEVATRAGIDATNDRHAITAHRFRHTVGTELAEGGARLHTIMKMLGHTSTGMTLVYAHISDAALREDYRRVLGPGAKVAGGLADQLRAGAMSESSLDWIKMNFFKTELELGRCLRLPEEGPCECDLYLSCAKFVTTPAYAPRLRDRRQKELDLIVDAKDRGWGREVERHSCTVRRIDELLAEMGETREMRQGADSRLGFTERGVVEESAAAFGDGVGSARP
jgi:integrase